MARGIIKRKSKETAVQPKLKVGQPGDKYEQEADAMADRVVTNNAPEPAVQMAPTDEESVSMKPDEESVNMQADEEQVAMAPEDEEQVSMKDDEEVSMKEDETVSMMSDEEQVSAKEEDEQVSAKEEEEVAMMEEDEKVAAKGEDEVSMKKDEEQVSTKEEDEVAMKEEEIKKKPAIQRSGDGSTYASPNLAQQIHQTKGQGQPMNRNTQQELGGKMGADFSKVKIHTDQNAAELNDSLGAKAFTHGHDIYFNKGNYDPGSSKGKHLLAHELTHVVQQKGGMEETAQLKSSSKPLVFNFKKLSVAHRRFFKFKSTKAKSNVKIILHHRPIVVGSCTIGGFLTKVDNAERTEERLFSSGDESKWKRDVIEHQMNNAQWHHFKVIIDDPCVFSGDRREKQLETYAKIIVS